MTDFRIEPELARAGFAVVQGGTASTGIPWSGGVGMDPLTAAAAASAAAWAAVAEAEIVCVATDDTRSGDAGTAMIESFRATEAANAKTLTI